MQSRLWSLTFGNFAIGTGAMIVPGMLNELSAGLAVTPSDIGVVISAFALTVCIGGPFLVSWTGTLERRRLLTATLVLYAVMHLVAALVPGYHSLLTARVVTGIGAALFTSQAAATVGLLVPPAARGRAMAMVFLGWSIAAVVGMPLGAYLGAGIGWRPTMALVGVLSACCAAWVWRQIPAGLFVAPMGRAAWKSVFTNLPMILAVAVTALQLVGAFSVFSYMALLLKEYIGATPAAIGLVFLCFGISGVTGNVIGARLMDRVGPVRIGYAAMGCVLTGILLWPFTQDSLPLTLALALVWGLGTFCIVSAQQVRLVTMAPELASASVALNSSAVYLGQAVGAFIGGQVIATFGTARLPWFGALPVLLAIALSAVAAALAGRRAAPAATG